MNYARTARPASEKQVALITRLAEEKDTSSLAADSLVDLTDVLAGREIALRDASDLIDGLFAARRKPAATGTAPAMPEVPAGHYAVEVDGVVKFYRVDRPTQGKWKGYTFLKVQASDDFYPVRGAAAREILAVIAADVMVALTRYGHEIGRCGICNRTLTDEESRARGIGPICAAKL